MLNNNKVKSVTLEACLKGLLLVELNTQINVSSFLILF